MEENEKNEKYDGLTYIREKKIRKHQNKIIKKSIKKPILIKGYMRPDKTSYYVTIPKKVRELLNLKGGEYFIMSANLSKKRITLELTSFEIYEDEEDLE
ncbi:MAG: hypothetical protein ACTSVY_06250 [Candidatus Helarchaeota archaeon]